MTRTKSTVTRRQLKPLPVRAVEARSRARSLRVRVYVVQPGQHYRTISQSGNGTYRQVRTRDGWTCTCQGFEFTNCCKHLAQVERRSEREGWTFGRIARHCSAADQATTDLIYSMLRAD